MSQELKDKILKFIWTIISLSLVGWIYFTLGLSIYTDWDDSYNIAAEKQSRENYQQIGFPEGYNIDGPDFDITRQGYGFFATAIVEQKPTTPEQKQALKERVDKYYFEKLAKYGWAKVPGYKYLYKKGDKQWMSVKIEGNLIILKEQTALFWWYDNMTQMAERE